jgi:hypothetical protein
VAELYLDNDVSLRLAPLLRAAGHRVTTTRELGLTAAPDDAQLLTAAQQGWTLATSNRRDFRLLHSAWRTWGTASGLALPPHPGILILDPAPPADQFQALEALLAGSSRATLEDELCWWHRAEGWRHLVGTEGKPYPD